MKKEKLNEFVTWEQLEERKKELADLEYRTCKRMLALGERVEEIEKRQDENKIWLDGFVEGFMKRIEAMEKEKKECQKKKK